MQNFALHACLDFSIMMLNPAKVSMVKNSFGQFQEALFCHDYKEKSVNE